MKAPRIAGGAGDQAEDGQADDGGARLAGERRDDGQAFGGVVECEAKDEEGAEGELADRVGRADRQALAEVVQADAGRDQQ